jgi:hypothetical protein
MNGDALLAAPPNTALQVTLGLEAGETTVTGSGELAVTGSGAFVTMTVVGDCPGGVVGEFPCPVKEVENSGASSATILSAYLI